MRKLSLIIFCIIIVFLMNFQTVFAVIQAPVIQPTEINDDELLSALVIDNKVNDGKAWTQIDGNIFVIGSNYRQTEYNEEEQRHFWYMDYIQAGEYYLARDLREAGIPQWKAVPLLIYDNQFNLVKEQYFSNGYGKVLDMSYVNGKYYCIYSELFQILENEDGTQSYQTFGEGFDEKYAKMTYNSWPYGLKTTSFVSVAESNNGLDWTTVAARLPADGYQNLIPRSNGEVAIARQKTAPDNVNFKTILYEDKTKNSLEPDFINDYKYVNLFGNWFLMYEGGTANDKNGEEVDEPLQLYLTNDNVYFVKIVPERDNFRTGATIPLYGYEVGESIYVVFSYVGSRLKIPKAEVYAELERLKAAPYVQVNDKVLGFETPPVTESDRTLVPMRFLFEQLGAEVTWDEGTQTATAAIAAEPDTQSLAQAKSVSFAIDNTTATVNGAEAVMDVPARLVNDKTMVPLRFLSENLGYLVSWNEETNTATVIDPAEFSADKTEHPELSETTQQHYVIYQEGYRNGRIELALFDIADGSAQSLVKRDKALELTDNSKYQNDSKWYWEDGKWIPFEEGYERISNNAVAVIASDLPVAE
ncbi:copper amine oxidase N-terminal domain-containing protein [Ructibacterium gallinarum]|uniref:Copper amine oxidase N-terminal domain-containing protein n=1 Tax=Ructibacterium gallinarum TaxID=2779355 RepID=A0A9D5M7C4_9FIRM|nr:copper amine oxidase N-terminal domain-containing protein [Ructibacterium gallinarum]MBE5040894.1 copper amine oxidase N-terminal domain-containing protein [Ructibacterium gallinarum]